MSKRTSISFKSYKSKITAILAGSLLALSLFSCANNADDENGSVTGGNAAQNSEAYQNALKMQKRLSMYEKILGTWVPDTDVWGNAYTANEANFSKITIEWGYVTLDDTKYVVDSSDLYLYNELEKGVDAYRDSDLVIKVGTNYVSIDSFLLGNTTLTSAFENPEDILLSSKFNGNVNILYVFKKSTSSSGSGQTGSGDTSALTGTYAFTTAVAPQMNGSVTLSSNGNWSYAGDKSSPAASSGTFTVNGSKVTVNWKASGLDMSETFTVTTSGSSSTWTSDNDYVSTFFSMLFGVTGKELTFTKS